MSISNYDDKSTFDKIIKHVGFIGDMFAQIDDNESFVVDGGNKSVKVIVDQDVRDHYYYHCVIVVQMKQSLNIFVIIYNISTFIYNRKSN